MYALVFDNEYGFVCCAKDLNACLHVYTGKVVDTRHYVANAQTSARGRAGRFQCAHKYGIFVQPHFQSDPESAILICNYTDHTRTVRSLRFLEEPRHSLSTQGAPRVVPKLLAQAHVANTVHARQNAEEFRARPTNRTLVLHRNDRSSHSLSFEKMDLVAFCSFIFVE